MYTYQVLYSTLSDVNPPFSVDVKMCECGWVCVYVYKEY